MLVFSYFVSKMKRRFNVDNPRGRSSDGVVAISSGSEESDASVVELDGVRNSSCAAFICTQDRASAYGLGVGNLRLLCKLGVPVGFLNILWWLQRTFGPYCDATHLRCIEVFAGIGNICKTFLEAGVPAAAFDILHHQRLQNILLSEGFVTLLQWCRRLKPSESFTHWGILCKSWVFMSRNSTGRRFHNVAGLDSQGMATTATAEGNLMASRCVLLLMYLHVQRILFVVEQPSSSLLFSHQRFLELDRKIALYRSSTSLGAFGGRSAKPILLMSNHPLVRQMYRPLRRSTFTPTATQVVVEAASGGVSGGPDLHQTQEYPAEFAEALFEAWSEADASVLHHKCIGSRLVNGPQTSDLWPDANLAEVCQYFGIPHDRLAA